ncbi:MAG: FAD-dependent oxidoreductase [Pseudomonadales bacterium]
MHSNAFSHLLSPACIGSLELKNRILMTPMGSNLAEPDGHCGERIQRYYEERAKGGVAMIIVGVGAITWPVGACNPNQVAVSDDTFLPGLTALTSRVHKHGGKAAIQLQHAGKVAVQDIAAGRPMLVPSLPHANKDDMMYALTADETNAFVKTYTAKGAKIEYRVATKDDVLKLAQDFASAAERAQRAGFDGVELHAGHGYILSSFLSAASNQRDDEYGGELENRARLLVEVITAVKEKVGKEFPVWCRLDAKEFRTAGGITLEDAVQAARMAEGAGADAVHVSAYADPSSGIAFTEAPLVHEPGGYIDFAKVIKKALNIPVIAVGRIAPEVADKLIAAGDADFVAMGRKLLADPDLPNKLEDNRPQDIRPCIYCYTCVSQIFINNSVKCAVNPATGRENEFALRGAETPKRVLVVGGGPAGMETARIAALRGHMVTLCERDKRLGGTVFFSSLVYAENADLIKYLETRVRNLAIDIHLEQTVDADFVNELAPQAIVLATGAKREAPAIPGADRANVFSGDELRRLMTSEDTDIAKQKLSLTQLAVFKAGALLGVQQDADKVRDMSKLWMPVGNKLVIVGGGLVGVELAEFLVERGRLVTVLEESDRFGVELAIVRRWRVLHALREAGVTMVASAKVSSIDDAGVHYSSAEQGDQVAPADTVILASGATVNDDLYKELEPLGIPLLQAGDCTGVSYIEGAMYEGALAGRAL